MASGAFRRRTPRQIKLDECCECSKLSLGMNSTGVAGCFCFMLTRRASPGKSSRMSRQQAAFICNSSPSSVAPPGGKVPLKPGEVSPSVFLPFETAVTVDPVFLLTPRRSDPPDPQPLSEASCLLQNVGLLSELTVQCPLEHFGTCSSALCSFYR